MKINQALIQIALKEGISVAEVRKEIQTAIDAGLNNPDPKIQEYWAKIPKKGKKHTPDEVIAFLAKEGTRPTTHHPFQRTPNRVK